MKSERNRDRWNRSSRLVAGGGKQERGYASDPFLVLIATLVLLTAAALIGIGMPQALEIATRYADASTAILPDGELEDEEGQAPEETKKKLEPLIVDDVRTEGVMRAYADVFCPIEC